MSCSAFYDKLFDNVFVEEGLEDTPTFQAARRRLQGHPVTVVRSREEIPASVSNQSSLFVCRPKGNLLGPCPGTRGHLCCNYLTLDLYVGCALGCRYCILKSFLKNSPITIYLDPEPSIREIRRLARKNSDRCLRIGSGEVGDSLLLDPIFELSKSIILAAAPLTNVYFELKTKTHFVEHLLDLEPKGNTVIGFSLNPPVLIEAYDGISSSLAQRLDAARKAVASGYLVSFHFDPMILTPNWEKEYTELVSRLSGFPSESVAWVSLGTMRYPPQLKDKLGKAAFLLEEFVPCRDGKFRYLQKIRSRMYRLVSRELSRFLSAPIYLCMESESVWHNVFGENPREIPSLSDIFTIARQGGEK